MPKNTVKSRHFIGSQLAAYIKDEFPLIDEFFSQYYNGLDFQLAADIDDTQDFLDLYNADGFPNQFGIVQVDDEIMVYQLKIGNRLLYLSRGFTGVSSYDTGNDTEELTYSSTEAVSHSFQTPVKNLSVLFLQEFLKRIKAQLLPGLQTENLSTGLNQAQFIRQS